MVLDLKAFDWLNIDYPWDDSKFFFIVSHMMLLDLIAYVDYILIIYELIPNFIFFFKNHVIDIIYLRILIVNWLLKSWLQVVFFFKIKWLLV